MDQTPIITPPDWTAENDLEDYVAKFGESQNYYHDVLQGIAENYAWLTDTVDSALAYLERKNPRLTPVLPETLTLAEKLDRLSCITNTRNNDYSYKARFGEQINDCRWVDRERSRILMNYYVGDERQWLKPLSDLSDAISCATTELEDAMKGYHGDYLRRQ